MLLLCEKEKKTSTNGWFELLFDEQLSDCDDYLWVLNDNHSGKGFSIN